MSPVGRTGSAPPAAAGELGGPWGAPPPLMAKGSAAPAEDDTVQIMNHRKSGPSRSTAF